MSMCFVALIFISCASTPVQWQQNDIEVLKRAEELVKARYHQDFGKIWDLATPWLKQVFPRVTSKEIFIEKVESLRQIIKITDYDSPRIVVIGEKHAITQVEITYEFREEGQTYTKIICERTLWLKFPDEWYWHDFGYPDDYMPSAGVIEWLTQKLR